MILHLDLETKSDLDLSKTGLSVYARGKHTDMWCAGIAFDEEPVDIWLPGMPIPERVVDHIESGGQVWAHNAAFERALVNHVGTRKHGWPYLYTEQMVCTMAMAYAMGLPGSLEGCAAALGITEQKDMDGNRVMKQLMYPRSIDPLTKLPIWWDKDPKKLEMLYKYCRQDVIVERMAAKRMLKLSPYESGVYRLDQKINDRGIKVDVKTAFAASMIVEEQKAFLNKRIQVLSEGDIATCSSVAQIKKFLVGKGVKNTESIDKAAVLEIFKQDISPDCREILQCRQDFAKASTAKLEPMIYAVDKDHRLRGMFQYSGANTRRWAGRRVQIQNLPRQSMKPELIDKIAKTISSRQLTLDEFKDYIGEPMSVISQLLRGCLIAESGKVLSACDFSAIEARVTAWVANETKTLEVFERGLDPYIVAAADIFGVALEKVTKDQRAVGKVAILALGFGGGVGAFQAMARGYNVKTAPAFEALLRRASEDHLSRAEKRWESMSEDYKDEIDKEEFLASELIKLFWREVNPNIVSFWAELERAAVEAVLEPGKAVRCGPITYKVSGSFLFCRLPSGGVLSYPYPEIRQTKTPWGQKKPTLTYMAEDSQSRKWLRFSTFGGSLTENVVQAIARDLLADAMLKIEAAGYPIVMHVHDEIVCETEDGDATLKAMRRLMNELPAWAKGLPIDSAGFTSNRYRKG